MSKNTPKQIKHKVSVLQTPKGPPSIMNWSLFNQMIHNESDVDRLLRETLNTPSPFKYVIDPTELDNHVTTITYKDHTTQSCPITMDDFTDDEPVNQLPCGHIFKPDAINDWLLTQKAECPVCRFKLPCIEVRNEEEQEFNANISTNRHLQSSEQERENNTQNIRTFINNLRSLDNLSRHRYF